VLVGSSSRPSVGSGVAGCSVGGGVVSTMGGRAVGTYTVAPGSGVTVGTGVCSASITFVKRWSGLASPGLSRLVTRSWSRSKIARRLTWAISWPRGSWL
jgi:hypothetical protein